MPIDCSTYLNYPGLKYLQRKPDVDWNVLSNSYLNYSGLKRLESNADVDADKNFLSREGLMYLMLSKFAKIARDRKV